MSTPHPKQVRREILELLYDRYQRDPMHSLMPAELYAETSLAPDDITPAAFYLHERGLVELLVGYNPPNFDAIRISPKGIDLVEDRATFNAQFPSKTVENGAETADIMPLLLELVDQIDRSSLAGARRSWLLDDLKALRNSVREPMSNWDPAQIQRQRQLIDDYLDESLRAELDAWSQLSKLLQAHLARLTQT